MTSNNQSTYSQAFVQKRTADQTDQKANHIAVSNNLPQEGLYCHSKEQKKGPCSNKTLPVFLLRSSQVRRY